MFGQLRKPLVLTWHGSGHGPTLNAGADGPRPLAGEGLDSDVVGRVWLQALDGHPRFCGAVGAVVLTVDISVHHSVLDDLPVPLGQRRGLPSQVGGGGGQADHAQVLGIAAGNVLWRADLLHVLLPVACSVFAAQFEDVGGSLVEPGHCEMIVCLPEVFDGEGLLLCSLVLQLVSHMLPDHLLGRLPLDQGSVPNGGADHHSGLTRNWGKFTPLYYTCRLYLFITKYYTLTL